jgi:hypothetical protein
MTRRFGRLIVLVSLVISSGVLFARIAMNATVKERPAHVSLVQPIATPEKFDGRVVRVVGFCRLEFDVEALYLHREDLEAALTKNSVRMDLGSMVLQNKQQFTDVYVLVEGVFSAPTERAIHGGLLDRITRFERYPSRAEMSPPR